MLPGFHIGYKNILNLNVKIVGVSKDGLVMLHYGHTGYRNTIYLQYTQMTLFECNICNKYFTLNESLKFHGIEVHSGQ